VGTLCGNPKRRLFVLGKAVEAVYRHLVSRIRAERRPETAPRPASSRPPGQTGGNDALAELLRQAREQQAARPKPPHNPGRGLTKATDKPRAGVPVPAMPDDSPQPATRDGHPTAAVGGRAVPARGSTQAVEPAGPPPRDDMATAHTMHGLALTYTFDTRHRPQPQSVTFTATRVGERGPADPPQSFQHVEPVPALPPGAGMASVTARVHPVEAGTWTVVAVSEQTGEGQLPGPATTTSVRAVLYPLTHGPAVRPWAWPALVFLGVVVALTVQWALVGRAHADQGAALEVSVAATFLGYLTAKSWYMRLHRVKPSGFVSAGTCIQGFLAGAFAALAAASALSGLNLVALADRTAPGVLLAMAVGRPGCWLGGCCAGRPTGSRWGLLSSDRRVAVRRIPVQLLEAAVALATAGFALAGQLAPFNAPGGATTVAAFALYTLARQVLFRFRYEPRRSPAGPRTVAVVCVTLLLAYAVLLIGRT